jgi:hypothetical protein
MNNQPRGAERCRFIRPDTREIGALVTEQASQLSDSDTLGCGLELNEGAVASYRNPCAFERLAHKERARRRRRSSEGDEVVSGKTRSSLRRSAPGEIAVRGVERITLHAFRFLGLAFVIPGVVSSELPAAFAQPVAYGDLLTAILALLALAALRTRSGTTVTWVFNTFGTADLLFGFYLGSRISLPATPGLLGAGYFIVAAYVPLLLITHGLAFRILLRTKVVVPSRNKLSTA